VYSAAEAHGVLHSILSDADRAIFAQAKNLLQQQHGPLGERDKIYKTYHSTLRTLRQEIHDSMATDEVRGCIANREGSVVGTTALELLT
jgi:hypothetical protein